MTGGGGGADLSQTRWHESHITQSLTENIVFKATLVLWNSPDLDLCTRPIKGPLSSGISPWTCVRPRAAQSQPEGPQTTIKRRADSELPSCYDRKAGAPSTSKGQGRRRILPLFIGLCLIIVRAQYWKLGLFDRPWIHHRRALTPPSWRGTGATSANVAPALNRRVPLCFMPAAQIKR